MFFHPEEKWGIISLSNTYNWSWGDFSRKGASIIATGLSELTSGKSYFPSGLHTEKVNKYNLKQNYPNPFSQVTSIEFKLSETDFVTLKIINALGQNVATLVSAMLTAGTHKYDWDAGNLPGGVYIYKLEAGGCIQTRKMLLVK